MTAITVDDERPMLKALTAAVESSPDITSVNEFSACSPALEWVSEHKTDIAFLDINMRGMGGLALAEKILAVCPNCKIVFCTGFSEYAVEAFKIHVSGYLMKPITTQAVQNEIDHIKGKKTKEKLLTVRCFGNFEVYSHGKALNFKRSKSKELLAVLIDRRGAGLSAKQICNIIWKENTSENRKMNYLHQLFIDLRNTLENVGAKDILLQNGYSYSVDTERIDCDYFDYVQFGSPVFSGEYMSQYSWAEETCALLWRR